jgi:Ca-activated chloride channel family protein
MKVCYVTEWCHIIFVFLNHIKKKIYILFFLSFCVAKNVFAQQHGSRILFLLDASGSMNQKMGSKTRFEMARELLYNLADSLEKKKSNVEIGVRVFGHQYQNSAHNCEDSKFEIPFAKGNSVKLLKRLKQLQPKGYTPIAYSIFKAAEQDFPLVQSNTNEMLNAIVLITDGEESCDGNPCAAALLLEKKRISLKPFIIGLGLQDSFIKKFNCVGTYFDAKTEDGFKWILKSVVSQIMGNTTLQINLLDKKGDPTETNVELTINDSYSHQLKYAYVHSLNDKGISDTIKIDPIGKYDLVIHTLPAVIKKNISLNPGKHNIIAADIPQGNLQFGWIGNPTPMALSQPPVAIIRQANLPEIINVQDINSTNRYLVGEYDIEVLTIPETEFRGFEIKPNELKNLMIQAAGTASILFGEEGSASLYTTQLSRWKKIYDWGNVSSSTYEINIQPGEYDVVFIPKEKRQSEYTQTRHFKILTGGVTRISFKQ